MAFEIGDKVVISSCAMCKEEGVFPDCWALGREGEIVRLPFPNIQGSFYIVKMDVSGRYPVREDEITKVE